MTDEELSTDLQADLDEALLALEELLFENPEEAITMYDKLPVEVQGRPEYRLTLARAHQAIEQYEAARDIAVAVVEEADDSALIADAHHLLGDLVEDLGDSLAANKHFLKTLELDKANFAESSTFTEKELIARITGLANRVVEGLPEDLKEQITGIDVSLFPSTSSVEQGIDPRCYSAFIPDASGKGKWSIFAANLDAEYGDLEELGEFDEYVLEELEHQLVE